MTTTYINIISFQQYIHPDLSDDLVINMLVIHVMSNFEHC